MVSDKTTIADLPIHTFEPKSEGQPWIAFIGSVGTLPIYFRGPTQVAAYGAAFKWRKEELTKVAARNARKETA